MIKWPDKLPEAFLDTQLEFEQFIPKLITRLVVGHFRYGKPKRNKKYLTSLKLELEAYEETGNQEHLFNIANYCILESMKPEHEDFHFKANVRSVTRGKV